MLATAAADLLVFGGVPSVEALGYIAGGVIRTAMSTVKRSRLEGEGEAAESNRVVVQRQTQQLTYSKERYGTPMDMRLCKAVAAQYSGAVAWVTYQWGKLTSNALATGTSDLAYQLKYKELVAALPVGTIDAPATAGANATEFPFHMFQLCNRHYYTASNGADGPGRFAYADSPANNPQLKFGYLTSVLNSSTGTATNDWNVWSMYGNSSADQLRSADVTTSILKDVRIEMLLQGAIGAPTTFHLDLISIHDDDYGPDASANLSRDEAYFPMIRKLLGNPVNSLPRGPKARNTIRVLKSWTYYMAPGTSIDYDTTPPQRHVTIDIHPNKVIKWNWQAEGPRLGRDAYDDANAYTTRVLVQQNLNPTPYPPDYRDRLFFIVRATNTRVNIDSGNTIPQYDIRIKATHVFNCENDS